MREIALAAEPTAAAPTARPRRKRGRPPIHLAASLNLVMPSQFFPEFPGEGRMSGEKRLMLAVLNDAINILLKHRDADDTRGRRLRAEAADWLLSDDTASPFAFVNVCEAVGLDPTCLRRGLARSTPPPRVRLLRR